MKALVTGCAGFIGSSLVDALLDKGNEVIGIDCFTDYYSRSIKEKNLAGAVQNSRFEFIDQDLLLMDSFPDADYVFHLAAQAGVRASWGKDFRIYTRNNIEATQKLLEFYKDSKPSKFVYASSSSVYGNVRLPMKEDSILKPVSPYGVTKLAAENLCYLYWKNFGVPTVSLRYFTVFGPRQRPDMGIHKFIRAVLDSKPITIYGDGNQTRDFTYVGDAVNANILAAQKGRPGEVYNIGGGNRITVNDLICLIEDNTGKKAAIQHVETQKGDVDNTWADVNKAREELGWSARFDVETGLKNEIEWIKNQ